MSAMTVGIVESNSEWRTTMFVGGVAGLLLPKASNLNVVSVLRMTPAIAYRKKHFMIHDT